MVKDTKTIEELFSKDVYSDDIENDELFYRALKEELIFHYENNEMYKRFCERKDFSPYDFFSIQDIPPVAVSVFKNLGESLSSVSKGDIKTVLQSSATSGVPSTVMIDKITAKRQSKAMIKVMQPFIGKKKKPFMIMDIDPRGEGRALLGARFAAVSGYLKFSSKTGFFLKQDKDGITSVDVDGMMHFLESIGDESVVLFGFTYVLFSNIVKAIKKQGTFIQLPKGSMVIHIGGWKKLENERISKIEFNNRISSCFGISPDDVIDIYGFTEQMGLNYPDYKDGWKKTPIFSRVLVRDPQSHKILEAGEEGVLEFISPLPHSYPGNVVLTDDLGVIKPDSGGNRYFKITGRIKKAEIRGCGDVLSQKLFFQNKYIEDETSNIRLNVLLYENVLLTTDPKEQLQEIIDGLLLRQSWLQDQPVDAVIGLISKVAKTWIDNPDLLSIRNKGLLFLSSWCDERHLISVSKIGLRGDIHFADSFIKGVDSAGHMMKANPRGIVCHWLAGNVQILGLFALVQSIISKNVNLLKVSSNDDGIFCSILNTFRGVVYETSDGHVICGDDLLKTIGVVYYPHSNNELGMLMSERADVRIAWGGRDAINTISNYTYRIGTETVLFGPKLSFAVIGKEVLSSYKEAKKIARRLSVDISVFDQTGCASPHNLYIEEGGEISINEFLGILALEMGKTGISIPKGEMTVEDVSKVHSIRSVYDFKGTVIASDDMTWTILLEDQDTLVELCTPVYSRVIFVHPVKSIFETIDLIDDNIQTIGMACELKKGVEFANLASNRGAERFPEIGRMLNFEMPWDGVFLFDRLVRWNTLGGPLC